MSALLLIFVCMAMGMLVRRYASPPPGIAPGINWWLINVSLPALVLELIPKIHYDSHLWFPVAAIAVVFFGAWLLFMVLGHMLHWPRQRVGALVLVCGLGNTAFMGYPMIQAMYGKTGLAVAVVADQLGSFPLLSSVGVLVASLYAGRVPQPAQIARRILTFPAFVALVMGALVGLLGGWPVPIETVLASLGATLTPLALFSVGLQFRLQSGQGQGLAVGLGLGWKLCLAPFACWLLGRAAGVQGLTLSVGVLQAAMAPMISAVLLADDYELDPVLANTVLGLGIVFSLVTIPIGNAWLSR